MFDKVFAFALPKETDPTLSLFRASSHLESINSMNPKEEW